MDHWTVALLAVAGYVAVMSLVRLMVRHRDELIAQFRTQMKAGKTAKESKTDQPPQERRKNVA